MKLSVVIISWNDLKCILDCIESVLAQTSALEYEIIVADNGSTDGSVESIRGRFPGVQLVENGANVGFGKGNNAGFRRARGEYVLILNPDTLIRDRALEKLVAYAERHPEAGAFGCRVLNSDGSVQLSAHPLPTLWGSLVGALWLRWPGRLWHGWPADSYLGWDGRSERQIGFQAGCCLLVRGDLLKELGGFDERFFHQFEDADLCCRVWKAGQAVAFCPSAEITHIGGQNRGTYPTEVVLETQRSKYKYFYKHYREQGGRWIRYISLLGFGLRYACSRVLAGIGGRETHQKRLELYRVLLKWHWAVSPARFIESGDEPDLGYRSLAPGLETSRTFSGNP